MIKKKTVIIFFLILILPTCIYGSESENDDNIDYIMEQLEILDIEEIEEVIKSLDDVTYDYFPEINFKDFVLSMIKGERTIKAEDILKGMGKFFLKEVAENIALLIQILAITIVCAILTNLQSSFENDTVGKLAYYICYILLATIVIKSFTVIMTLGKTTVDNMVNFMQIILPILLTLLVAVGGITSNAIFHPIVLGTVNIVGVLVKDIIFPFIFFSFTIGLMSRISEKVQFTKLSELLRQVVVTVIGISLTIFIGIMSMYGIASKVDGVTVRTAKFAMDKFIPIVGKFLSDAMDTVVGCSAVLKNAVGVIGLFTLFLICIIPIIKIIALIFVYKVVIAVIEPVSTIEIGECLNEVSKSLLLVLASLLSVSIMFFITITIIVEAGNITVMLR
ncbi:stage III sporulation protein AE [Anaerosalibacter massiliensis]|uniref:Stage III sporulation protein AE n=1 Tax=Anaerosalibacter massiliensis TaxID=1347392 RepID=A0A9X2MK92_9FIRM|nr:stage III sporulation protein AE [Anaerosalibacter massiliensis]MCR2042801.1 stage III sporulation protein AE [Anaerosalibacter massiliensis]